MELFIDLKQRGLSSKNRTLYHLKDNTHIIEVQNHFPVHSLIVRGL